ncbi:MAG: 3-deoxy-D-manno-octulosonic acid transferase [Flavobacterium sp.]|nr:3-deoxy-D-manno-octulosonic acid transferase [Pedobacter sp.]
MLFLYNLGIWLYSLFIQIASLKSSKAKAWLNGRLHIFSRIEKEVDLNFSHIWFHFASLGEFEQGRTVLEQIRKLKPESRIVITFFSPSGYEIQKNYPLANHIFYLPLDTEKNAEKFISLINPEMAIFTKYEYWYHYFNELRKKQVPLYIISGIFRKTQPFFKWYGGLHRKMLNCVNYFFVQNEESRNLLQKINFYNVTVSGDTRFDRVFENAKNPKQLKEIAEFCGDELVLIAGSTWLADEQFLSALPDRFPEWKFIIVPHEIDQNRIDEVKLLFANCILFSNLQTATSNRQTLIIDNIGMLSSLYQYGNVAYIGGGFGVGIHNTLEAAAFGLPLIFGPRFQKFKEAVDLVKMKAACTISNIEKLNIVADKLQDAEFRQKYGNKARDYVEMNVGATNMILKHITNSKK